MLRISLLCFILVFAAQNISAAGTGLTVQNPSFELNLPPMDTICVGASGSKWWCPAPGHIEEVPRVAGDPGIFGMAKIDPWTSCSGTPDLLPNAPTLAPTNAAYHGDWYIGLVCTNMNGPPSEGIAQPLSEAFTPGTKYTFDIALSNINTSYMVGSFPLNNPGVLYIIGRMGNGTATSGCSPTSEGEEILWQSPPVVGPTWNLHEIELTPSKAWDHIYLALAPGTGATCANDNSNVMIDKIGSFFPGGLKITSPKATANMPCSQLIEGKADYEISTITVSGTFDGGTLQGTPTGTGKDWELQVSYSNQTPRTENLTVIANYVDGSILPDTIVVPVNIAGPITDFGTSIIDVNSPVAFTDFSPTYDAGTTMAYSWDFGDGTTSNQANPTNKYAVAGTYDVIQKITYNGKCSEEVTKTIVVPKEPGTIDITTPVNSQDLSECSIKVQGTMNYAADEIVLTGSMPGGSLIATPTSDTTWEAEVFFSGSSSGAQSITATASFPSNQAIDSVAFNLTVSGDTKADFTITEGQSAYDEYTFTNTSTSSEAIGEWRWTFNQGAVINTQDVSKTFTSFGNQIVTLQVVPQNPSACGDIKTEYIDIPTPALSDKGNYFNDADHDGQLDQVVLRFESNVDVNWLTSIDLDFKWFNNKDSLISVKSGPGSWKINPKNPKEIIWNLPDSLNLKRLSTDVKVDYGQPQLIFSVNNHLGQVQAIRQDVTIADGMAPLIKTAQIKQGRSSDKADTLMFEFTEAIAKDLVTEDELFEYLLRSENFASAQIVDNEPIGAVRPSWFGLDRFLNISFVNDNKKLLPGDSVRALSGQNLLQDLSGNTFEADGEYVEIQGKIVLIEKHNEFVSIDYTKLKTGKQPFDSLKGFEHGTTLEEATQGQLGSMFTLVIPTIKVIDSLGREQIITKDPEDIEWEYTLIYYDILGSYVAKKQGVLKCDDEIFQVDGATNCLDSQVGVIFIPWNYRDETGRKVGTGAYIQQFIINKEVFEPTKVGVHRLK